MTEPKAAKNRLHLDLGVTGGPGTPLEERKQRVAAETERLVAAGATLVGFREELGDHWAAMLDPEGNEFDVQ